MEIAIYDFLRGPMLWISSSILVLGVIYRIVLLISLTRRKEAHPGADASRFAGFGRFIKGIRVPLRGPLMELEPWMGLLCLAFHFFVIVTPFFLVGHSILFLESWGVSIASFSEKTSDRLTLGLLACSALLLFRRLFMARVRLITTLSDYLLLFVTMAPFLTGYLAYHQFGDYETVIILHMASGELMMITLGVTKLGHMFFFFFSRFFIGSEYSFGGGSRRWQA
jgi:nitrate reductase gamma subunit